MSSPTIVVDRSRSITPFSVSNPVPALLPATAAITLRKLVALKLQEAGFDATSPEALEELEAVVFSFFEAVARQCHDRANLARRNGVPGFRDVMTSCEEMGIGPAGLAREMRRSKQAFERGVEAPKLEIKYARRAVTPPAEVLLASDDDAEDGAHATVMKTKDSYGVGFLPELPSRHAYRQTPVFPKSAIPPPILPTSSSNQQMPSAAALAHLSTLRSRLSDSRLVASSLRNLIRRTSARGLGSESHHRMEGGMEVDLSSVQEVRATGEQEGEDVIDYEGEWYGALGNTNKGRTRAVHKLRVGGPLEGDEEEVDTRRDEAREGGGMVKRRKWRV